MWHLSFLVTLFCSHFLFSSVFCLLYSAITVNILLTAVKHRGLFHLCCSLFFLLHLTPSGFTPATCPHLLKSWPASLSTFPSSVSSPLFPPHLFLASSPHSGTAILPLMSMTRYLVRRSYPATDWQALDNTAVNYWPVWSIETGLDKALKYIWLVVCLFFK